MKIDGIGVFELNKTYGWYDGPFFAIPGLSERVFKFMLDDFEANDTHKYAQAMLAFQKIEKNEIDQASRHIFKYYKDTLDMIGDDEDLPIIEQENDVWDFIQFGKDVHFCLRDHDQKIYASIECRCDWEEEHGLQIVFKEGKKITKIGPYDGHLSNADTYGDDSLEDVVYK